MLAQPRFKRLTGRQELEIIQVRERLLDAIGAAGRGRANLRSKRRGRGRHARQQSDRMNNRKLSKHEVFSRLWPCTATQRVKRRTWP